MPDDDARSETDSCPYLVPVMADRLWLRPVGAYCRRPGERVRVPATRTLARVCSTPAHGDCLGYRAAAEADIPVSCP